MDSLPPGKRTAFAASVRCLNADLANLQFDLFARPRLITVVPAETERDFLFRGAKSNQSFPLDLSTRKKVLNTTSRSRWQCLGHSCCSKSASRIADFAKSGHVPSREREWGIAPALELGVVKFLTLGNPRGARPVARRLAAFSTYRRSKRSSIITLFQALAKSCVNLASPPLTA